MMRRKFVKYFPLYLEASFVFCCLLAVTLAEYNFIDELFAYIPFGVYILSCVSCKKKIDKKVNVFLFIVLFYALYSIYRHLNIGAAIFEDIVQQCKPYVAFWGVYCLGIHISDKWCAKLRNFFVLPLIVVPIVLGIYGHEATILIFTGHESGYGGMCLVAACLYYYFSNRTSKNRIIFFVLLALGLLSGKSKFYGEFCLAAYLFYFLHKKIKLNLTTILGTMVLLSAIIVVAWEKVSIYFGFVIYGGEADGLARNMLYFNSFRVLIDYFPFGSGFGTYACSASSKYYSNLYYDYGMDKIIGMEPDGIYNFIADTYFPVMIGEFGLVGIVLMIWFIVFVWRHIKNNHLLYGDMDDYRIAIILLGAFVIESLAGPLILANVGVVIMYALALILSRAKSAKNIRYFL